MNRQDRHPISGPVKRGENTPVFLLRMARSKPLDRAGDAILQLHSNLDRYSRFLIILRHKLSTFPSPG